MKSYFNATLSIYAGLFLFVSLVAIADVAPEIPAPGEDVKLFEGKSAEQFFISREGQTDCRRELDQTRAHFKNERIELKKMIEAKAPADEIDAQERKMESARSRFLSNMEDCGECVTAPMTDAKISTPLKTQYWYITDGSCFLRSISAADGEMSYQKAKELLLHTRSYARLEGGFPSVMEFFGIDATTKAKLPFGPVTTSPYKAFIAVDGPLSTAFHYVMNANFEERQTGDLKEFILTFTGEQSPEAFSTDLAYVTASGARKSLTPYALSDVKGMWYITNKGYFRYYTAADFRKPFGLILGGIARQTLLGTLASMSERGSAE